MSKVYFTDLRTSPKRNLFNKIEDLLNRTKIDTKIALNDLVAVKLHFGEYGGTAFLRPVYLRIVVDRVKKAGGKPFLTDTNTLYAGSRSDSVSHLSTAMANGFDYSCTGAPIIIADGLRGANGEKISIPGEELKEVSIAREIVNADAMVVVTHVKAHDISGFGGALKNLGMGCATREGKLVQHSTVAPMINPKQCKGCKFCLKYCPAGAISMMDKKAEIREGCIGCGECVIVCPQNAVEIQWNQAQDVFQKKIVEYAYGAVKGKEKKTVYLNFIVQVSPSCDCYPHSDAAIVQDIGILASADPVAIDTASCDLIHGQPSLPNTAIKTVLAPGSDKWRALFPGIDWTIQLSHGEKLGLGEKAYTIVKI
ncbi:MAG: DUF362 domain-containing protein [Syntrophobacterales bacterium]|jgi:uncharacterized Fe-S center protein|nr:DUF362 domain-containing protein [Syntrophobacterales bacterium]